MAERAAKALNDLMRCNLHGVGAVDRENLLQFALDYFDDENPAQSDTEDDFDDGIDDGIDEVVELPDAPDLGDLLREADALQLNEDENNDSESHYEEEDSNDGPDVLVDETTQVLNLVADTLVSPDTEIERTRIRNFNCGCSGFKEGRCIKQFDEEYIQGLRVDLNALTNAEKEMLIMGKVSCTINMSELTQRRKKKEQTERRRNRCAFIVNRKVICRKVFKFMHW